jgi:two-component system CheB/CheR fusion protein
MKIIPIKDGLEVKPNMVYVIPPNKDVAILNGFLHLMDLPQPRGFNLPIDNFFRSLAQDQGSNAICIILSGTGTDGTLGLKEIKGEVGMVMVQDDETAKYTGMPRSAISTGLVDYVMSADKMPEQLIKYSKHAIIEPKVKIRTDEEKFQNALQKIFILLRSHTNHDFSHYKQNTITRRIERRMHVHQIDDIQDYVQYLQKTDREVYVLFKDLLIGVTSFFRDSDAFDVLMIIISGSG